MHLKTIGGLAAALLFVAGCDSMPSSQPPPEVARACVATMNGDYLLPAAEWVKPVTDEGRGRWEVSPEYGVIFRGEILDPLNGTTSVTSVLFVPAAEPRNAKASCHGYYEVSRVDVDGLDLHPLPFYGMMINRHFNVLSHYPPERLSSDQPLTLDYYR